MFKSPAVTTAFRPTLFNRLDDARNSSIEDRVCPVERESGSEVSAAPASQRAPDFVDGSLEHNIAAGETMTSIAEQYGVPLQALVDANPQVADPDLIHVNDQLRIPQTQSLRLPGPAIEQHEDSYSAVDEKRRDSESAVSGPSPEPATMPADTDAELEADLKDRLYQAMNLPGSLGVSARSVLSTSKSQLTEGLARAGQALAGNDDDVVGRQETEQVKAQADAIRTNHDTDASEAAYRADPTSKNWHQWQADLARDALVAVADEATADDDVDAVESLRLHQEAYRIEHHQGLAD